MISVIITAYKEEKTIGKGIDSILRNNLKDFEIIVVAPDNKTLEVVKKYSNKKIIPLKDSGNGKPAALNLAVSKAKGDILILTDGDVYVKENSLQELINPLKDKKVGAVSGHPISLNKKNTMLGYWAYLLTNIADQRRKKALKNKKRFFCSGYLFAIRKKLFPELPEEILSEDGLISNKVYLKGYDVGYSKEALVYVKYPTTFSDWIIQKKRSAGGYNQIRKITGTEMRSFKKESFGAFAFLKFIKTPLELFWTIELFLARIYLWAVIYRDINLKKKSHKEIWKRVETTK